MLTGTTQYWGETLDFSSSVYENKVNSREIALLLHHPASCHTSHAFNKTKPESQFTTIELKVVWKWSRAICAWHYSGPLIKKNSPSCSSAHFDPKKTGPSIGVDNKPDGGVIGYKAAWPTLVAKSDGVVEIREPLVSSQLSSFTACLYSHLLLHTSIHSSRRPDLAAWTKRVIGN